MPKAAGEGMTLKVSLIGCKNMLSHINSETSGERERLEERWVEAGRPSLYRLSQECNSSLSVPEEGRPRAKKL